MKNELLELAKKAAEQAGNVILEVYNREDFEISLKEGNSPLTAADLAAHTKIQEILGEDIPMLSEEGSDIPFITRSKWSHFWLVDPLDGTKEFIKRNGEFTVNIALISEGIPVLGVVYVPVTKKLYWATKGEGAYCSFLKGRLAPRVFSESERGLKIVSSRSHLNTETEKFLDKFEAPELVSVGSSLKILMLATGEAHIYPRLGPTMEWDTAAAQIILEEAGGTLVDMAGAPIRYNRENLLNPSFIARGPMLS